MKKKYFFIVIALISITLFIGVSCSKSSNSNYTTPPPVDNSEIKIYNMTFTPATKTVALGTVVKWHNEDGYAHTATSNDGTTFNSSNISGGGTYSYTTTVAGTFNYHCTIHGLTMAGTLIVTP